MCCPFQAPPPQAPPPPILSSRPEHIHHQHRSSVKQRTKHGYQWSQGLAIARYLYEMCVTRGDTAALPEEQLREMPAARDPNAPGEQQGACSQEPANTGSNPSGLPRMADGAGAAAGGRLGRSSKDASHPATTAFCAASRRATGQGEHSPI